VGVLFVVGGRAVLCWGCVLVVGGGFLFFLFGWGGCVVVLGVGGVLLFSVCGWFFDGGGLGFFWGGVVVGCFGGGFG